MFETLHSSMLSGSKPKESTQKYLDISEIKDGIVVLKDGSLRSVIMVSSLNFSLKSTEEQDAIIAGYQSFLNSLDFPIQIVIHSRKIDIDSYLDMLKEKEKEQTNELLRIQTQDYISYISQLVSMANIMDKDFYIVIPYRPFLDVKKGLFDRFYDFMNPAKVITYKAKDFERHKTQLLQRVDHVISGLKGLGLMFIVLNTQELIELFYNIYNPSTYDKEDLVDINKLSIKK